ncbi:hypothetical protein AAG570_003896 [Ranatra chinensis]|uniref:Uncharacterized protein n=1 Tax=Ranatra chinensis TaxID=642074 RepID=A0ABD0Y297_9HEMI
MGIAKLPSIVVLWSEFVDPNPFGLIAIFSGHGFNINGDWPRRPTAVTIPSLNLNEAIGTGTVAQHRLERLNRCRTNLSQQLDKFKEENDDLKFQLEEKSIELEATKARIRLLEKPLQAKNPALAMATAGDGGDGVDQCSSSTESAHQEETSASKRYHQPSRIPLKSGKKPPPSGGATPPARGTPPARQQQGPAVPRRPRKSSESSFNSTSSSPSVRTPPPPYSKKTPAAPLPPVRHLTNSPAERIVAESEPKIREFKVGSVSELPRGPCCGEGRNYAADSLEHMSCCGELDRSIGSAVATWSARHHSLDYFDSIDSSPLLNEALADYDSLNQMTSDMV